MAAARLAAAQDPGTAMVQPGKGLTDVDTVEESTGVRPDNVSEDDNQYAKDLKLDQAGMDNPQKVKTKEEDHEESQDRDMKAGTVELIAIAPKLSRGGRQKSLME